jgi:hypothetical protein
MPHRAPLYTLANSMFTGGIGYPEKLAHLLLNI